METWSTDSEPVPLAREAELVALSGDWRDNFQKQASKDSIFESRNELDGAVRQVKFDHRGKIKLVLRVPVSVSAAAFAQSAQFLPTMDRPWELRLSIFNLALWPKHGEVPLGAADGGPPQVADPAENSEILAVLPVTAAEDMSPMFPQKDVEFDTRGHRYKSTIVWLSVALVDSSGAEVACNWSPPLTLVKKDKRFGVPSKWREIVLPMIAQLDKSVWGAFEQRESWTPPLDEDYAKKSRKAAGDADGGDAAMAAADAAAAAEAEQAYAAAEAAQAAEEALPDPEYEDLPMNAEDLATIQSYQNLPAFQGTVWFLEQQRALTQFMAPEYQAPTATTTTTTTTATAMALPDPNTAFALPQGTMPGMVPAPVPVPVPAPAGMDPYAFSGAGGGFELPAHFPPSQMSGALHGAGVGFDMPGLDAAMMPLDQTEYLPAVQGTEATAGPADVTALLSGIDTAGIDRMDMEAQAALQSQFVGLGVAGMDPSQPTQQQ